MGNQNMIDTDAMYAKQQALYQEGVARTDTMVREAQAELEAGYARTDTMVREAQEQTRLLMKFPIKELDEIRFH
ncbi:hypothetical protein K8R33_04145 [archaeon]|nr:hypothetical protein [archaeon]